MTQSEMHKESVSIHFEMKFSNDTHLTATKNNRSKFASLFLRYPGSQHYAQCRVCGSTAEAHQDPDQNQRIRAT